MKGEKQITVSHTVWFPPLHRHLEPHQNSPPHHSPCLSTKKTNQQTKQKNKKKKQTLPRIRQAFEPINRPPEIALEPLLHRDQIGVHSQPKDAIFTSKERPFEHQESQDTSSRPPIAESGWEGEDEASKSGPFWGGEGGKGAKLREE